MTRSELPGAAVSPATNAEVTESVRADADRRPPADLVPWLIAAGVFAAYTTISVFRYLRLAADLVGPGHLHRVRQAVRAPERADRGRPRTPGFNLLGDHFHPIVALIAPFFRLFPSPVTLLVAQALLAALSVIPVSRAAADRLGTGAGRAIGAAYGFSWGLQQMVNYDFHEIAFAVPLLACSLSALVRGRISRAVVWALPLVFVKEDQGFTVAAIGLIMVVAYRAADGRDRAGGLGNGLVGAGDRRDHPALQRRPSSTRTGPTAVSSVPVRDRDLVGRDGAPADRLAWRSSCPLSR